VPNLVESAHEYCRRHERRARPDLALDPPEMDHPIEPAGIRLSGRSLAVSDGKVIALAQDRNALQRFRPRQILELTGHLVLQGLIQLHTNAASRC
jgi:hypothetical protein